MFSKCFEHVVRVIKKNLKNARMAGNIYKVITKHFFYTFSMLAACFTAFFEL